MAFLGTIINFSAILILGIVGSFVKKGVPERISDAVLSAMGVAVLYIGIDGIIAPAPNVPEDSFFSAGLVKILVMILSIGLGTLIGELIDIDKQMNRLGAFVERKLASNSAQQGSFAKGFVNCSILFCVGAMAVNGSIADAQGSPDILLAKSVIDGIVCFVMASSLGIGCAFSSFFVLLYQGALTLLGSFLTSVLPDATVTYMSVTGSLVIILIGTNMLGITKAKTANMMPTIFMPMLIAPLFALFT